MGLIDLLFPKNCVGCGKFGSYFCKGCLVKINYLQTQICPYCYKAAIGGKTHPFCQKQNGIDGVISLTDYKTPIKEFILGLKYRFTTDLLHEFSRKIEFPTNRIKLENWDVLPLPLHRTRENYRGFNQSKLLGKLIAEQFQLNFEINILKRVKTTTQQVGLSKTDRGKNMKNAFKVTKPLNGESYYVFDDVWTSGASLKSAALELKKARAKNVWGLTLAHPR